MSIVLGLDPGFAALGYAVVSIMPNRETVSELGVLRTEKSNAKANTLAAEDSVRRARELAYRLDQIVRTYSVDIIAAESMSFPRQASVAAKMAMTWGAIATLAEVHRLPIVQASPQRCKLAVCGSKTASKETVEFTLVEKYGAGLPQLLARLPKGVHEHAYDALSAVVGCLESDVIRLARRAA